MTRTLEVLIRDRPRRFLPVVKGSFVPVVRGALRPIITHGPSRPIITHSGRRPDARG